MASQSGPDNAARPRMEVLEEKRFAIVMYGGVSLAIYINGVVQELLRMVRATAPDASREHALLADSELVGTERVYRRLAQSMGGEPLGRDAEPDDPIRTRFVVDVLSGTSAGGINSIFLAKALANNQTLDGLKDLWIQEGEISLLLNDRKSIEGTKLDMQKPPKSLLNSRRMYNKLMVALAGMETGSPSEAGKASPLVEELDLFVTATDITGLPIELQLADMVVSERKHRQVFHFQYRDPERYGQRSRRNDHNDFLQANDAFLAFAARCTSSFPFAFEPMKLQDIDGEAKEPWSKFYADYRATSGERRDRASQADVPTSRSSTGEFSERAFGDGGYLDNKPFSYAIDAMGTRVPSLPTDRLLVYIEPNPAAPPTGGPRTPNAVENSWAAMSLARYETIREDLDRVRERNQLFDRVGSILDGTDDDIANTRRDGEWDVSEWVGDDLGEMIDEKGISYGSYLRLRVELLTDALSQLVIANSDWDPLSDHSQAMRALVRAWRDGSFTYYQDEKLGEAAKGPETFHKFLLDYDLTFYIRRLEFVLRKANEILPLGTAARRLLRHCGCEDVLDESSRDQFQKAIIEVRKQLADHLLDLRLRWDALFVRDPESSLGKAVSDMGLGRERLLKALQRYAESTGSPTGGKEAGEEIVSELLSDAGQQISELAETVKGRVKSGLGSVTKSKELVGFTKEDQKWVFKDRPPSEPYAKAAWALGYYMNRFTLYDQITLPILYATGVSDEHDPVEVIRISPRDAKSLIDEENDGKSRTKLGGTALANFGAFLDRGWRENDMLWGRLDGAERMIQAMLPPDSTELETGLVEQAHEEILKDFGKGQRTAAVGHLTETVTKFAPKGDKDEKKLEHLKKLVAKQGTPTPSTEQVVQSTLLGALTPGGLREFFKDDYEIYREPDRENTVRSLARATHVTGQMLEDIADEYSVAEKPAAWVTRLGRLFWGLVEVSVPRSLPTLFARHWQKVLLIFSVLMIVGGWLFSKPGVGHVGWSFVGLLVAFSSARWLLGDYFRRKEGFKRLLQVLAVLVVFLLLVNGVLHADDAWESFKEWLCEESWISICLD